MRLAFGVSVLAQALARGGADGIGNVTQELLARLRSATDVSVLPYEYASQVSGQIPGAVAVGAFQPQALWALATGASFPLMGQRLRGQVDLVHATDHYVPRVRGTPVLATLMDAIPLSHPEWVAYSHKRLKNEAWRRSAHWADHVLTISEFSRQEIMRCFRIPERRISVIPLGVDGRWFATPSVPELQRVTAAYRLPERYFLFVGTIQPRKNLERLVRAHHALPQDVRRQFPLLVVGRKGWGCEDIAAQLDVGLWPDVRWLAYVPGEDLPVMVSRASALVFPSLYEGFGLPVLEAFAARTPVIASAATSVPEVAGDAALLVDPLDEAAWRAAMLTLALKETGQIEQWRERGRIRAQQFSWDQTAGDLIRLYERLLGGRM